MTYIPKDINSFLRWARLRARIIQTLRDQDFVVFPDHRADVFLDLLGGLHQLEITFLPAGGRSLPPTQSLRPKRKDCP